jgi:D-3-phosphoglycerate dehydrogenase
LEVPAAFKEEKINKMGSLSEVHHKCDFITLNCDLNSTSFHLIGQPELVAMRRSAYLINTSRGPVVDEAALVRALREEKIAGAALDVFETEPLPTDSPLRSMKNCMLAPHNSNSSVSARERVHESTVNNLLTALREASP